eukprot:1616790-Alexandrium_andersonii.AAC.1
MSASLVGSEMCIRDRVSVDRLARLRVDGGLWVVEGGHLGGLLGAPQVQRREGGRGGGFALCQA